MNILLFRTQYALMGYPDSTTYNPVWQDLIRYAAQAFSMTPRQCELALTQKDVTCVRSNTKYGTGY